MTFTGMAHSEIEHMTSASHPTIEKSMACCELCPRSCKVNRLAETGVCGKSDKVSLARAALHFWEEPPISGKSGSGTVFFSGCNLKCVYCQNRSISTGAVGKEVSIERLAEIFLEQQERGALNINLVTPTHYVTQILAALDIAKGNGLVIPIVYNCGGYESVRTVKSLAGYVDIFLTDFKYAAPELGKRYSKVADYPTVATKALDAMFEVVGPYTTGKDPRPNTVIAAHEKEDDVLHKGVVVRHLLLPGHTMDSLQVLDLLAAKPYAKDICISLMSQFTPSEQAAKLFPELASTVDSEAYELLVDWAEELGFENMFIQEGGAASESFIPSFDYEGV